MNPVDETSCPAHNHLDTPRADLSRACVTIWRISVAISTADAIQPTRSAVIDFLASNDLPMVGRYIAAAS
ncbi:hypothetical protein ACFJIW_21615 [Tahibacter sp. UC22_41]|uniref:hypothetical protein n=1 Tax=Tahibacter sp. UC22_41 TaxID=3350178 RepID=UPI0036DB13C4